MKTIPIKPERQAELEEFARRQGKPASDALDEALAQYLEWEKQDAEEAVQGIQHGYEDMKSGRTRPVESFLDDMRRKHGFSLKLSILDWLISNAADKPASAGLFALDDAFSSLSRFPERRSMAPESFH
jgi:predicted transcriptional regulator